MIGVLALQGDFHAHGRCLERLGAAWRPVVRPDEIGDLGGLIIPGGESTTMRKLLTAECREAILSLARRGGALYGTCAGALLLSRRMLNPPGEGLGLLDAEMVRNSYGRQVDSFILCREDPKVSTLDPSLLPPELIFIRAPRFKEVGKSVEILASAGGHPVYLRQGRVLATTFHPELTYDSPVHRQFLGLVSRRPAENRPSERVVNSPG